MTFTGIVEMAAHGEVGLFLFFCLHALFSTWLSDLTLEQWLIIWFLSPVTHQVWQEGSINIKPRKEEDKEFNSQSPQSCTWQVFGLNQLVSTPWSVEAKEDHRQVVLAKQVSVWSPAALTGAKSAVSGKWTWVPESPPGCTSGRRSQRELWVSWWRLATRWKLEQVSVMEDLTVWPLAAQGN